MAQHDRTNASTGSCKKPRDFSELKDEPLPGWTDERVRNARDGARFRGYGSENDTRDMARI